VATSIVVASFLAIGAFSVFAQESGDYIINRVEVWGLFYRLMVVAFTVGAVLMGVFAYVIFRFRESNKKNIPREPLEEQGR
jgi:heme/copper-type cytochrome/quinol oxidase subunit 2